MDNHGFVGHCLYETLNVSTVVIRVVVQVGLVMG